MRGFHDEFGGPESLASPSEWGPLSFGDDGMTAAGLPASPGAPGALLSASPSEDELRHNHLLRRQLHDPGYGASRELSWRKKAGNGLRVPYVPVADDPRDTREDRKSRTSPSELAKKASRVRRILFDADPPGFPSG